MCLSKEAICIIATLGTPTTEASFDFWIYFNAFVNVYITIETQKEICFDFLNLYDNVTL